jgi:hypothetical protein
LLPASISKNSRSPERLRPPRDPPWQPDLPNHRRVTSHTLPSLSLSYYHYITLSPFHSLPFSLPEPK